MWTFLPQNLRWGGWCKVPLPPLWQPFLCGVTIQGMIIAFIKELSLCHKLITISLEPNFEDLRYFKLWILLNQIIRVWNIKGLQHRVLKILGFKYLILLQRLNSFRIRKFKFVARVQLLYKLKNDDCMNIKSLEFNFAMYDLQSKVLGFKCIVYLNSDLADFRTCLIITISSIQFI